MSRVGLAALLGRQWSDGDSGGAALLLGALAGGYRRVVSVREWLYASGVLRSHALGCPVVSVGNLTVGGTGKTPAVELAVRTLVDLGQRPAVVSRGYRRRTRGVQVVADAASIRLDAEDAGDEPFLLARRLPGVPVVVAASRHDGARFAVRRFGVSAIVLDDGFQHRTLRKDLEIVMVRAGDPWGNGRLLPRGPLREPLTALRRAHLVVAVGAGRPPALAALESAVRAYAPRTPLLVARHAPVECWEATAMRTVPVAALAGRRLLAFAGIATPDAFATTLGEVGVRVDDFVAYLDHHWYTVHDLARIERRAVELGVDGLVTTEKDWVRLRTLPPTGRPLYVVRVCLELVGGRAEWRAAFERVCRGR